MIRRRFRVTGRVQGVFFRAETRRTARALGLRGFVRNEPDGSVVLEAAGNPAALERLAAWLHQGPPRARVDAVEEQPPEEGGPETGEADFEIRR